MGSEKLPRDKARYHLFSDDYSYYGQFRQPTKIEVVRYNSEKTETEKIDNSTADFSALAKEGYVNWIRVSGLADSGLISKLILDLGFHPVDCKAVMTPLHAAKIDLSDHRLIIILRACFFNKRSSVTSEHMAILSRDNFVITFREKETEVVFDPILGSIAGDVMGIRSSNRIMLVAFALNAVFAITIETAVRVEEMLEKLDDTLLESRNNMNVGRRIQECRHANLILQKNNTPLRSEFVNIAQSASVTSDPTMMQIYDELSNQLDLIILSTRNSREMLSSMRDMYASSNEMRTNSIMRRLTVVSTLFIPITFLVGLWGMNFKFMPELDWKIGYPLSLIILAITALGTWRYMKKNDWF